MYPCGMDDKWKGSEAAPGRAGCRAVRVVVSLSCVYTARVMVLCARPCPLTAVPRRVRRRAPRRAARPSTGRAPKTGFNSRTRPKVKMKDSAAAAGRHPPRRCRPPSRSARSPRRARTPCPARCTPSRLKRSRQLFFMPDVSRVSSLSLCTSDLRLRLSRLPHFSESHTAFTGLAA